MKLKTALMMSFLTSYLAGCDMVEVGKPAFVDVARKPPLTRVETVEYLVRNDRPMAVWIEEMAAACDDLGCVE